MSKSTSKPAFRVDELAGKSLAGLLLEVQARVSPNRKSANLRCLRVPQGLHCHDVMTLGSLTDLSIGFTRDYVAVSYSCQDISDHTSSDTEGCAIVEPPGSRSPSRKSNVVLKRAARYADNVGSPHIWMDKYCIDQTNGIQKRLDMDSIDLAYSGSKFPVGLMSTVLGTADSICLLGALLDGKLASEDGIAADCDNQTIERVLNLLQTISADRFWTRAWILQEEYLSGIRMKLLIRHSPELEPLKKEVFGSTGEIEEEICFGAAHFREVATVFLLALQKYPLLQQKSTVLLRIFSKYNVLYNLTASANRKAISFKIMADLHERSIKQEFDKVLIGANICGYTDLFTATSMAVTGYSVNLCTLAMMILNGEVIRNNNKRLVLPTSKSIGDFLDDISFDRFDPPVAARELSWLKNCRFPKPRLVPSGIKTKGYLWRVTMEIRTYAWQPPPRSRPSKSSRCGLNNSQRAHLLQLMKHIRWRKNCKHLVKQLRNYLADDLNFRRAPNKESDAAVKRYKDLMANEVCNAIEAGQTLYLAAIAGTDAVKAIFVEPCKMGASIFTAWSYGMDKDGRTRTRHLSLSLRLEEQISREQDPHLELIEWVNGLTFFTWRERRPVVVSWPEAWLRTNPDVIELSDDEDT
ncbi:hypothetical protein Q7P35_005419 [Cladosporium inversicolor]